MARSENRSVSGYVSNETSRHIDILAARFRKKRSSIIRLLLEEAVRLHPVTTAEIEAWSAAESREGPEGGKAAVAQLVALRPESIEELERRWRDDDTPPGEPVSKRANAR